MSDTVDDLGAGHTVQTYKVSGSPHGFCESCGKTHDQVRHILSGPHGLTVCDECAEALIYGFEQAGVRLGSCNLVDGESLDEIKRLQGVVNAVKRDLNSGITSMGDVLSRDKANDYLRGRLDGLIAVRHVLAVAEKAIEEED